MSLDTFDFRGYLSYLCFLSIFFHLFFIKYILQTFITRRPIVWPAFSVVIITFDLHYFSSVDHAWITLNFSSCIEFINLVSPQRPAGWTVWTWLGAADSFSDVVVRVVVAFHDWTSAVVKSSSSEFRVVFSFDNDWRIQNVERDFVKLTKITIKYFL